MEVGKFQDDNLKPVAEEMKVSTRNCLVSGSLPVGAVFVCNKNELVLPLNEASLAAECDIGNKKIDLQ